MSLPFFRSLPASVLILHSAAWLVPAEERKEWLAEWEAELWHVCRTGEPGLNGRPRSHSTGFCVGAFQDAFWLKWNHLRSARWRVLRRGAASRCTLLLAVWAAASLLLFLSLPAARNAALRSFHRNADGLFVISRSGYSGMQSPTIGLEEYLSWKTATRQLFSGIAFYQPLSKRVHVLKHRSAELAIGRASDNLFQLLNRPLPADPPNGEHLARLFLTQAAWRQNFNADPALVGAIAEVAGQRVVIAGILSPDTLRLPGHLDAWLLEDEEQLAKLPKRSSGFLLARMRRGKLRLDEWQHMTVYSEDGSRSNRFDCISLAEEERLPFSIFVFTLIVALIALPATTPLPLGEYPHHDGRLPWAVRARRWVFFCSKIVLFVPLVYFTSVDAAYGCQVQNANTVQYIQLGLSFFGFLFGFRWILQDQRKRCPVCLRVLSNPARVGEASRNFLAWNGTEWICTNGHGLLHIPELPTSWFGTQRWLDLDASWHPLFSDGCVPSAGVL